MSTMTVTKAPGMSPEPASHPGEFLAKWMRDQALTTAELARAAGISYKHLRKITKGDASYSAELALRIGEATGLDPWRLMHMQCDYELDQARKAKAREYPYEL